MRLLLGTSNPHKVREISQILGLDESCFTTPADLDIRGEPVEDGANFLENAIIKALFYHEKSGLPTLADDTGLEVIALGGQPGLMSARFAGSGHNDAANRRKLIGMLRKIDDRRARFVCHAVLAITGSAKPDHVPPGVEEIRLPRRHVRLFHSIGEVQGRIVLHEAGHSGFGYDPVFFVPELDATFAQVPQEVKNRISHRANAMKRFSGLIMQMC